MILIPDFATPSFNPRPMILKSSWLKNLGTKLFIQAVLCLHGSLTTPILVLSFVHLVLNHSSAYMFFFEKSGVEKSGVEISCNLGGALLLPGSDGAQTESLDLLSLKFSWLKSLLRDVKFQG